MQYSAYSLQLFGLFEKTFCDQYSRDHLTEYQQLDKDKRVLIIDDFHKLRGKSTSKRDILAKTVEFSSYVIVFGDAIQIPIERLSDPRTLSDRGAYFPIYRIRAFGHLLRNKLIEQWVSLADEQEETAAIAQLVNQARLTIDIVVGKNYVPAYPIWLFRFWCGLTVNPFKRGDDNSRGFSERNIQSRGSRRRRV